MLKTKISRMGNNNNHANRWKKKNDQQITKGIKLKSDINRFYPNWISLFRSHVDVNDDDKILKFKFPFSFTINLIQKIPFMNFFYSTV